MSSQRREFRDTIKLRLGYGASSASDSSQPTVASLVKHSPKPSLAKIGTDGNAFKVAWMKFFDGLPPEERKAFIDAYTSITPEYLVQEIINLDRKDSLSAAQRLVNPTKHFLTILDQLLATTSSFASLGIPDAPSIIIGGAKLIIKMVLKYVEFFEKLTDMLRKLTVHLGHLREASKLERMVLIQESTANFYVGILKFYHHAYSIFKPRDHRKHTLGHFRRFGRVQWESFDAKFGEIEGEIQSSLDVLSQAKGTEALHQISNLQSESTKQTRILSEDQRHNYFGWISPKDFDTIQREGLQQRWPGTGNWLLNHEKYKEWFHGQQTRVLWCYGRPGSGKSVLSSIVMDHIQKDSTTSNTGVGKAFVSFRYDDMETQKPAKIIAAVLKQLSSQLKSFPVDLADFLSAHFENHRFPSPEDTTEMISKLNSLFSKTFIVMDALDECEERPRAEIFQFISRSDAKFFITSRPESSIRETFNSEKIPNLEIKTADTQNDIEEYVRGELESRTRPPTPGERTMPRRLRVRDVETKELIYKTLVDRANGVFLWVKLQLDNICRQANDEDILEVLSALPEDLFQTYGRILKQIERGSKPLQTLVLKCLMWALNVKKQPFEMDCLICAIASDPDFTTFGQITNRCYKYTVHDILDACHNLLTLEDKTVRPVHYSLAEFFEQNKEIKNSAFAELQDQQLMESRIAKTCLVFLKLYHSKDGPVQMKKRLFWYGISRFKAYCANHFDQHVIAAAKERFEDVLEHLDSLLSMGTPTLGSIARLRHEFLAREATAMDFLYITHLYELPILAEDKRWNTQALHQSTLTAACIKGPIDRVRKLVDFEAIPTSTYWPPLLTAVHHRQDFDMIELLLNSGAGDLNERFGFDTILEKACQKSSVKVVEALLSHGAKGIEGNSTFLRALNDAAMRRNLGVAHFLLNRGVCPTSLTLWNAILYSSEELVRSILEKGVDPNSKELESDGPFMGYDQPLYCAAFLNRVETMRRLLHFGAEIDVKRAGMGTALHAAAYGGNLPAVTLLLEHGADVNASDSTAGPPLMISALMNFADVSRALLDAGADMNKSCQTSMLHAACQGGDLDLVRLLIDRGANVNEQKPLLQQPGGFVLPNIEPKGTKHTVLEATFANTFSKEKLEIVELLINSGAKINASSETGTALSAACSLRTNAPDSQVEAVKLLLAAGAEVNASVGKWTSTLEAASMGGNEEVVDLLLSAGKFSQAQMDVALRAAVCSGSEAVIRTLFGQGALPRQVQEPNQYSRIGELPLPSASFKGNTEMTKVLIAAGDDVNKPDLFGSPLESALLWLQNVHPPPFMPVESPFMPMKWDLAATITMLRKAKAVEPSNDCHIGIVCQGPLCNPGIVASLHGNERVIQRKLWIQGVRYFCSWRGINLCGSCKEVVDSDTASRAENVNEEGISETDFLGQHRPEHKMIEMATRDIEAERIFVELYSD